MFVNATYNVESELMTTILNEFVASKPIKTYFRHACIKLKFCVLEINETIEVIYQTIKKNYSYLKKVKMS